LRILAVCTHNRTRSVMFAALLEALLGDQLGRDAVAVKSSGFAPVGLPPIPDAVDAMRRRGLDVSAHRSSVTTLTLVDGADLILTAERDHVVKIAGLSSAAFRRTFTLPEFVVGAATGIDQDHAEGITGSVEPRGRASVRAVPDRVADWAEQLSSPRRAAEYLRDPVPEVADPTGSSPPLFEVAVQEIERQCREAAEHLIRLARD
jgi:protein-tyrosine-phosphatase